VKRNIARRLVISALLGNDALGAGAPCGRSQKTAHGFSWSSACATGQVLVIAACGRFREFPKLRQVARPRTVRAPVRPPFVVSTVGDSLETFAEGSPNSSEISILAVAHGNRTRNR
jgi:hypothetical protein